MKRFLLWSLATFLCAGTLVAQVNNHPNFSNRNQKIPRNLEKGDGSIVGQLQSSPVISTKSLLDDATTMTTVYDLQSNSSVENRLYYYPGEGTLAATATMAHENTFTDRGTGYNFFNGTSWGPQPASRIETVRTGWPAYAPLGPEGEIVIAHQSGTTPLIISTRTPKGTGTWTQSELYPPSGASGLLWPRMVTGGPDHTYVHLICMTAPTGNGGVVWNDLDGALIYNRSLDGGVTWDGWQLLDGMTSSEFMAFSADSYSWAEPKDNFLCFTSGDNWYDQFIMKSTDNGGSWTKTTVWPCPFTFWAGGDTTGAFFCPDGTNSLTIDNTGKVHLAFGLQRASGDEAGSKYWYPFSDGVVYWNEDMEPFPGMMDWDSLYSHGNIIGWVTDTMVWYAATTELAYYYNSMTSHPNLINDESGHIYCIWDQVTTLMDVNQYMLRHLYGRASFDGGEQWGDIIGLTDDFLYNWSECVFPFMAKNSTQDIFFIMQEDPEAGLQFYGSQGAQGQTNITQNNQIVGARDKSLFYPVGVNDRKEERFSVSRCYPNPASGMMTIKVTVPFTASLSLDICSLTGQNILSFCKGETVPGIHDLTFDVSVLPAGIYFCTVRCGTQKETMKMVVE